MIYWLFGQPASGKTTLALKLIDKIEKQTFHIDGDNLRDILHNHDYSKEGREKNLNAVLDISRYLDSKNINVVISVVAPYNYHRNELSKTNGAVQIYVHTDKIRGRENNFAKDFEEPNYGYIDINTSNDSIEQSLNKLIHELDKKELWWRAN